MRKPRLIFYNDARHYHMYRFDPPMSLHRLRQPIDELLGTGVDTLMYGLAAGTTFLHDSRVGARWGELNKVHNHGVMWWRAYENLMQAIKAGYDPLKVVIDRGHEKGIQVFCSIRINEGTSPKDENLYMVSKLKFERPDLMIGGDDPRIAGAFDFAKPEVRKERLAVIEEVCDRYGADGIEIDDYIRVFFKPSEVKKNTPILTDFVREVRSLLNSIGKRRGQKLCLAARVHAFEEGNLAIGMDVRRWLNEKLVDIVMPYTAGGERTFVDTNPYAGWLIEAAHDAGAWVYTTVGREPYDDRFQMRTVEMFRAALTNYQAAGFDGLYITDLKWPYTEREYKIMREMGDPDIFARKTKHYMLGPAVEPKNPLALKRYIPATLREGEPVEAPIFIADKLESAKADNELDKIRLGVRIVQTGPNDVLVFKFNGRELSTESARISTYYGGMVSPGASKMGNLPPRINTHYWFEFDLPRDLVWEGENRLSVEMKSLFKIRTEERVLQSVELHISYKEPPVPVGGQM